MSLEQQTDCISYGVVLKDQKPVSKDFMVTRGGNKYRISVCIPEYISDLDKLRAHEGESLPDTFLVLDGIESDDQVCRQLSEMDDSALEIYLTPITPPESEK